MLFRAPNFKHQNIPLDHQEIFHGDLVIKEPFKIKLRTRRTNEAGEEVLEVKEVSEFKGYNSMDVYQYAMPEQGFIILSYERINSADSTTLVTALIPAFNKDDGMEEQRKHLERAGIPYIEIPEPTGKNSGIGHVTACRWLGFQPEIKTDASSRMGGGLFKQNMIVFRSQSQNVKSITYDEFFLLARGLNSYDEITHYDDEFFFRRLIPFDVALPITKFLQGEMKAAAKAPGAGIYKDDGIWLPKILEGFKDAEYYLAMEEWGSTSLASKKDLLLSTLSEAIKLNDPNNFSDRSLGLHRSYIDRIFNLNNELKLNLNLNRASDDYTLLGLAVQSKNTLIVEKLLKAGANMDVMDSLGHYPLWYALHGNDYKMVSFLLQNGASKELLSENDDTYNQLIIKMLLNLFEKENFKAVAEVLHGNADLPEEFITSLTSRIQVKTFNILCNDNKSKENESTQAKLGSNFPDIYLEIKKFIEKPISADETKPFMKFVNYCAYEKAELLDYKSLHKLDELMNKANLGHLDLTRIMDPRGITANQVFFQNFRGIVDKSTPHQVLQELNKFKLYSSNIFNQFIAHPDCVKLVGLFAEQANIDCLQFLIKNGAPPNTAEADDEEWDVNFYISDFLKCAQECNSAPRKDKIHQAFAKFCEFEAKTMQDFAEELLKFKLITLLASEAPTAKDKIFKKYLEGDDFDTIFEKFGSTLSTSQTIGEDTENKSDRNPQKNIEAFYLLQELKIFLTFNSVVGYSAVASEQLMRINTAEEDNNWQSALTDVFQLANDYHLLSHQSSIFKPTPEVLKYTTWFKSIEKFKQEIIKKPRPTGPTPTLRVLGRDF